MDRNDDALEVLSDALEKAEQEDLRSLECSILDEIAMIHKKEDRPDEAESYFTKGLERSSGMDYEDTVTELFIIMPGCYGAGRLREGRIHTPGSWKIIGGLCTA